MPHPDYKRAVTEADFRMEEFRDAKPEDYEFRRDGRLVRKDRWERAVHHLASQMGMESRGGFEIPDVLEVLDDLVARAAQAGVRPSRIVLKVLEQAQSAVSEPQREANDLRGSAPTGLGG